MAQVKYEKIPQSEEDADSGSIDLKLDEPEQIEIVDLEESVNIAEDSDASLNQGENEKQRKEKLKLKAIGLTEKKLLLREILNDRNEAKQSAKPVSTLQVSLSWSTVRLKAAYHETKDTTQTWGIWRGHLKIIGGHFGNGVLSYFTFLRWLFYLNCGIGFLTLLFITVPSLTFTSYICMEPTTNGTVRFSTYTHNGTLGNMTLGHYNKESCSSTQDKHSKEYVFNPVLMQNVIDFFQGTGWMNTTVMFYGRYENSFLTGFNGWIYNLPFAYLLTTFAYLMLSLYLIISTAVTIFEEGYIKGGESNAYSFSNTIFGGWDMCITNDETASLASACLSRELEAAAEESRRRSKKEKRTKRERWCLKAIRCLINVIIISLLCAGGFAIYRATKWTIDESTTKLSKQNFKTMMINYASPITITAVNTILPTLFYKLSEFEDFSPRTKIKMDLARTVLVKLASICVLVATLFRRKNTAETTCWENLIGAEMYKLVWMEFFVAIFVTLCVEFPRGYIGRNIDGGCKLNEKVGIPEFSIPDNVLSLVYAQTIIWVGTFYSPLLPMMGSVKLFITFYIKKGSLMRNFIPPQKPYRAGKSNYFFMILQLISFALSLVATVYAITQIRPSTEHGPFRGFNRMYDIWTLTLADLPQVYRYIFNLIFSPVVVMAFVLLLCLTLYFYRSMYRVYSHKTTLLQLQLKEEQSEKKKLLRDLGGNKGPKISQGIEKKISLDDDVSYGIDISRDDIKSRDADETRDLDLSDDVNESHDTEGPRDVLESADVENGDGTRPQDAETGPLDEGTGPKDAGIGPLDEGTEPQEIGTGPQDTEHSWAPKDDDKA